MKEKDELLQNYLLLKHMLTGVVRVQNNCGEARIIMTEEMAKKVDAILSEDDDTIKKEFYSSNIYYIVTNKWWDLTSAFIKPCREHADIPMNQIPEAVEAMNKCKEFERVCKEYFNINVGENKEE